MGLIQGCARQKRRVLVIIRKLLYDTLDAQKLIIEVQNTRRAVPEKES